jgi:hypothetical protein
MFQNKLHYYIKLNFENLKNCKNIKKRNYFIYPYPYINKKLFMPENFNALLLMMMFFFQS